VKPTTKTTERGRAPTARLVAGRVLARTLRDGAFAAAALSSEIDRAVQLDARERALTTELVYGALRYRALIDAEIVRASRRGKADLDPETHAHLLVAGYQLFGLDRVPAFAAVNEAVALVRAARGERVSGFANAVLRRLSERASTLDDSGRLEALVAQAPEWLRAALERSLGAEGARAFLAASHVPPPPCFGVPRPALREAAVARARELAPGAEVTLGRVSPLAFTVKGGGNPAVLAAAIGAGTFVQEEGSQLLALAAGAKPGDRVLDACAGRGNKTALLASLAGTCDAADLHPKKLERLVAELSARGVEVGATFAVDWAVGTGDATGPYDVVLVDSPCSGTGTLRRRPDLWLRRTSESLAELAALEGRILSRAATLVRPGGRLVYSVCSVLRDEAEDVVAAFLAEGSGFEPAPFASEEVRLTFGDTSAFRLLPSLHGTDGYFAASFVRVG